MSNDNGGYPPPGQQPPAYPGAAVPPQQQPGYPGAAPQQPVHPGYPGAAAPQPGAPAYPGTTPPAAPVYPGAPTPQQTYPGAAPTAPGYPAASYAQPYGQPYAAPLKTNGLAIASIICGIASVVFCWAYLILPLLAGVPAVITGHMALKKTKSDPTLGGRALALTGLITGYIGIGLGLLIGALLILALIATFSFSRYGS